MSTMLMRLSDRAEAAALDHLVVRLIIPAERARWDALVSEKHYLKNAVLVGEQLRYVVEYQGRWLALLGWSAAAYHLKGRDAWIGWSANQRRARLALVANNARFCLLSAPGEYPNLASRALALNSARLSADWQEKYGHPILVVESFVDLQSFRGTAYKAAGWRALGPTAGFQRVADDFYVAHERPKRLYVRELTKHALRHLRQRHLPDALQPCERNIRRQCELGLGELQSLWDVLRVEVPESRSVHGLRHKQATVLALTYAYLLAGGQGGHRAVALFAEDLTPTQRAALGCWFNGRTRQFEVPSENCVYRVLKSVPVLAFQQALWRWQRARYGATDGDTVVLDGKALRGSGGIQLVGAVNAQSGRVLGVETVADKSNEIPAGRTLLERLELDGAIALMDALHTQVETARRVVQEGGGDYVLFVKGNQGGLLTQAQTFLPERFSPSTVGGGAGARADGVARHRGARAHAGTDGLSPCGASGTLGSHPRTQGRLPGSRDRVGDYQPDAGASRCGPVAGPSPPVLEH